MSRSAVADHYDVIHVLATRAMADVEEREREIAELQSMLADSIRELAALRDAIREPGADITKLREIVE